MGMRRKTTVGFTALALAVLCVAGQWMALGKEVAAANTRNFQAGNIIDDNVFQNAGSMDVADIQNFLQAKNATCLVNFKSLSLHDTNNDGYGDEPYGHGSGHKVSAAKLIWQAAQIYDINPKVILVTLQKEQGLITRDDCPQWRYRTALGYGCPDSAPCNDAAYGFTRQIDYGVWHFRGFFDDSLDFVPYTPGKQRINYHPNAGCGGTTVDIKNRATAALYSYTPYQPNQASLNAGYGTGNGCSSYGNRNFWLYFTDWFGSTIQTLVKVRNGGPTVYLSWAGTYYRIPSMEMLRAYGLDGKRISYISASQLQGSPKGPALGRLATFGSSGTVYFIDDGVKRWAPSWELLGRYGYDRDNAINYSDTKLRNVTGSASGLKTLVREPSGATYYMESGKKRLFPDWQTFTSLGRSLSGNDSLAAATLSGEFLNGLPDGAPVLLDGSIIQARGLDPIYLYDQNKLRLFTPASLQAWGGKHDYTFSRSLVTQIDKAGLAPLLVTNGAARYLVSEGEKHYFTPGMQAEWGISNQKFGTVSSRTLAGLSSGSPAGTLIRLPSGTVYLVSGGERHLIPTREDFEDFGYRWSTIMNVDNNTINSIAGSGTLAFAPGSLIRLPSGAVSWIDTGFDRHLIPSRERFSAFGFSWNNVRDYGKGMLDGYTGKTLQRLVKNPAGTYYLTDRGRKLFISATNYGPERYAFAGSVDSTLDNALIADIRTGQALTQFIQGSGPAVYKIENGKKHAFGGRHSFYAHGGSWDKVRRVSDNFLRSLPSGRGY